MIQLVFVQSQSFLYTISVFSKYSKKKIQVGSRFDIFKDKTNTRTILFTGKDVISFLPILPALLYFTRDFPLFLDENTESKTFE